MKIKKENVEKILDFMRGYNDHFDELVAFLAEKYKRVVNDDLVWLLDSLVEEQRLIMRGNSIEAKRLRTLESMGLKDATFNQLIDNTPEELRPQMKAECLRMQTAIDKIKASNADVVHLVEQKLGEQELKARGTVIKTDTYTMTGARVTHAGGGIIGSV